MKNVKTFNSLGTQQVVRCSTTDLKILAFDKLYKFGRNTRSHASVHLTVAKGKVPSTMLARSRKSLPTQQRGTY
eukprot:scaffold1001_cov169-Amphora_coffeaeformis.AAC.30